MGKEWHKTEGINISEEYFKKYLSNNIFYKKRKQRYFHDQDIKINEIKITLNHYLALKKHLVKY